MIKSYYPHYIPTTTHCCLAVYNTGLSPFLEFDYIMILIVFFNTTMELFGQSYVIIDNDILEMIII